MKAYFKQGWGISFIIMGAVLLVLNFMLLNMGGSNLPGLLMGFLVLMIGILYLTRPVFELRSRELVLFNLLGMEMKRFTFDKFSDFQVMDGKIYLSANGNSRRVRISKVMVKNTDWERFMRMITGDDMTRELHNI